MKAFGVRFEVNNEPLYEALRSLYEQVRFDQKRNQFRPPSQWVELVPDAVKGNFSWPTSADQEAWLRVRNYQIVAIPPPAFQLGAQWDFDRVFEAIEESEYDVLECARLDNTTAELRINPHAYPYGGVGPLIALAEAFGFTVLGVNEYGKYETREELLKERGG